MYVGHIRYLPDSLALQYVYSGALTNTVMFHTLTCVFLGSVIALRFK